MNRFQYTVTTDVQSLRTGISLCMRPANERRRYNVTSSLTGWAHIQMIPTHMYRTLQESEYKELNIYPQALCLTLIPELRNNKIHYKVWD